MLDLLEPIEIHYFLASNRTHGLLSASILYQTVEAASPEFCRKEIIAKTVMQTKKSRKHKEVMMF